MTMMMIMMRASSLLHAWKPALLMVVVQVAYAGVSILYKLAASDGMNSIVIVAYRYIFATGFMVPFALIFERNGWTELTWRLLLQAFLSGLFGGSLCQNLYVKSISLSSPTLAAAMYNLIPAVTFILAVSFGLEKAGLGTVAGKAKALGTAIGIGGAMLLTLYKGPEIRIWSTHVDLLKHEHALAVGGHHVTSSHASQVLGCLLAFGTCISFALWLIIQTKMMARYPYPYTSTALMSVMASIQSAAFAVCTERDWSQWILGWNVRLLTVVFAGIVASGLVVILISWCVSMRGPLFVSVFNPLMTLIVALAGSTLLQENLHLGSVMGATFIICGIYGVLWGKGKEIKKVAQLSPSTGGRESETIKISIPSPGDTPDMFNNNDKIGDSNNHNSNLRDETNRNVG